MTTIGEFYRAWNEARQASTFGWRLPEPGHPVDYPDEGASGRVELPVHDVSVLAIDWARHADEQFGEVPVTEVSLSATAHADLSEAAYPYHQAAALTLIAAASPHLEPAGCRAVLDELLRTGGPVAEDGVSFTATATTLGDDAAVATLTATFASGLELEP